MIRELRAFTAILLLTAVSTAQVQFKREQVREPFVRATNAPVAPEAIYVGRRGAVSVIDLNGFGQGTGDIRLYRSTRYLYGYKRNPNLGQPGVIPPLGPAQTNLDAGSHGALTLTHDTTGSTELLRGVSVSDMQIGQPLDLVYNNSNINANVQQANQLNPATATPMPGNTIAIAPHPNPPRLIRPEPNPSRGIGGIEPTTTTSGSGASPGRVTVRMPPCIGSTQNKLVIGDPFAMGMGRIGVFHTNFPGLFNGPQPPPPSPPPPTPFCPYTCRQQIGHFLYVLDKSGRIVVANSNRMTILRSIQVKDPASLAMAPNLRVLAVSSSSTGSVSFIDTDPLSPTFHRVLASVRVGRGPAGLAWQPEGEALVVCNQAASSITIIDGKFFTARTLTTSIKSPIDVAVSSRQFRIGIDTWTWFAHVLNGDGTLSIFESGPRPIGPDSVRASGLQFAGARSIQAGASLGPTCFITHQDAFGSGQVSQVETRVQGGARSWHVIARYGGANATTPIKDQFSGKIVVDLAFDEIENLGADRELRSVLYPGLPASPHSGKSLGRYAYQSAVVQPSYKPRFLFVALADTGRVDVIELASGRRMRTLETPGVTCLAHYWRQ